MTDKPSEKDPAADTRPEVEQDPRAFEQTAPSAGPVADQVETVSQSNWSEVGSTGASESIPGLPGQGFEDFEVIEQIARGGMGVVYKARQKSLNRVVALKTILAGRLATDTDVERFHIEAQAAAGLDHPNIVPIFEIGESAGTHYFTMAYVDGVSLEAKVKKSKMPYAEAADLLRKLSSGLQYAHENGIVHRDLKPANILIDRDGRPRVTDFGLAKLQEADRGLTATGQMLGTPSYMSPEQAMGERRASEPPTDIYALGGILYFMLTGKPPVSGSTLTEVLLKVVQEEPVAPREGNPDVPDDLQAICLKCLRKEPGDRYGTVSALAADLDRFLSGIRTVAVSQAAAPRRQAGPQSWGRKLVSAAALAVVVVGVAWLLERRRSAPTASGQGSEERVVASPADSTPAGAEADEEQPARAGAPSPPADAVPPTSTASKNAAQAEAAVLAESADYPKPQRRDFAMKVEMLGSSDGDSGVRRLEAGKEVIFRITVERDAYVGIWFHDAKGTVVQLFPNRFERDHRVRAGAARMAPGNKSYAITPTVSEGPEYVRVVASTERWDPVEGQQNGAYAVFRSVDELARLQSQVRGLVLKPAEPGAANPPAVADVVMPFQVRPSP